MKVLPTDAPIDTQNPMNIEGIERNPRPSLGRVRLNLFDMDAYFQVIDDSFQVPGNEIKEAVDEGQNAVDDQADLSVLPSTSTLQNIDCMEYEQKDEQIHNDELTISTESCVLPDDPLLELPKNRLEKSVRISRGPYQPILTKFPVKITGTGNDKRKRSFSTLWYKEFNPLSPNRTFF
ncbi:hypothetical protein TKK_0013519 [Trichogramma kaykai]